MRDNPGLVRFTSNVDLAAISSMVGYGPIPKVSALTGASARSGLERLRQMRGFENPFKRIRPSSVIAKKIRLRCRANQMH